MAVDLGRVPWQMTAAADSVRASGQQGPVPLGKLVCHNGSGAPASFSVRDRTAGRILFAPLLVAVGGQSSIDFPPGTWVNDIVVETIPAASFVYVYPQLTK